jgi:hypothetical protein
MLNLATKSNKTLSNTATVYEFSKEEIRKRATASGFRNEPRFDSIDLDINEQEITLQYQAKLVSERNSLQENLSSILLKKTSLIDSVESEATLQKLTNIRLEADRSFSHIFSQYQRSIQAATDRQDQANRKLRYYLTTVTADHLVNHGDNPYKHYGLLVGIAFIEWVLLANFYAQSSDNGFIGGVFMAAMISLVNIGLSGMITGAIKGLRSEQSSKIAFSCVEIVFFTSALLATILFSAHYRFAANVIAESSANGSVSYFDESWEASKLAWTYFVEKGLNVPDVLSWFMMFAGIAFAVGFIKKSLSYKPQDKVLKDLETSLSQADQIIIDLKHKFPADLNNCLNQYVDAFPALRKEGEDTIQSLRSCSESYNNHIDRFTRFVNELDGACNRSLTEYRVINRKVATEIAPLYFANKYQFPVELTSVKTMLDAYGDSCIEMAQTSYEDFKNKMNFAIEEVNQRFDYWLSLSNQTI